MRFASAFLIILSFFSAVCLAQTDDGEIDRLKGDFKAVKVVVQVQIEKVEIESEWGNPRSSGGYTSYRFTGKVVEAFKGQFAKDDPIVFYSVLEGQPYKSVADLTPGNHLRFLEIHKNKFGLTNLVELENSAHSATDANLLTLRKLRRKR